MITLNFAMIAMMIGSNMLPMNTESIHSPVVCPTPQVEVVCQEVAPAVPIDGAEVLGSINKDKTREQCAKEAFERIYAQVNELLDQIPEQTDEQFQLQRMM